MTDDERPQRSKNWDELSVEEQVGRMREVVKGLTDRIEDLVDRLGALEGHEHASSGKALTTLHRNIREVGYRSLGSMSSQGVWF